MTIISSKKSGFFGIIFVALLIIAVFSALLFSGTLLSPFAATPVSFSSAGSQHSYTIETLSSPPTIVEQSGSAQTGTTSFTWPIANVAGTFALSSPPVCIFNLCATNNLGSWLLELGDTTGCYAQGSASSQCQTSAYTLSGSISAPTFLSQANNAALWTNEGPTLNNQNPYSFTVNYTSTVNAPKPCTATGTILSASNQCVVTLYVYRYYVTVDMHSNNAGIAISCYSTCQLPGNYQTAFQAGVQGLLSSTFNPNSKLTNTPSNPTTVVLQLGIPQSAVQSNLQTYGILGAWTANPAGVSNCSNVGDLCVNQFCSSSNFASCSIVQSNTHTSLGIWKDPQVTQGALPVISPQVNVAGYTAAQLAQAAFNLSSTVYTHFELSSFGAGFSMNSACSQNNLSGCVQTGNPDATLTIMYDIVGAKSTFYQYPSPPAQVGTNSGNLIGQVVDGSLFWHPGVPGAVACLVGTAGCASVDSNGNFMFQNIQAGPYTVQVTAPGYVSSSQLLATVNSGGTTNMGQISLAESNPWYNGNLCFGTPLGQVCVAWTLIFLIVGAIVVIALVAVYVNSPGPKTRIISDSIAARADRLTPRNPLSRTARGFVSRRIAVLINEGKTGKEAQGQAFNEARQRGYHVPPPPKNK